MNTAVLKIANTFHSANGEIFLTGGAVRDYLLNKPVNDYDCEIYGLEPEKVKEICESLGRVSEAGQSFAVLKLTIGSETVDISLPRTERKVGLGHKGFFVSANPFMDKKDACKRRDFSVNAMLMDPITGEILDFYSGKADLNARIIRHVDAETFVEDSLRVLRACGFAARFNFTIAEDTLKLCQSVDLADLPAERIKDELFKLLLKSEKPSIGIKYLHETFATEQLFPELYHVYLDVLDEAAKVNVLIDEIKQLTFMLAAMLWTVPQNDKLNFLDRLQIYTIRGCDVRKQVLLLSEHFDKPANMLRTRANFLKLANTGVDMQMLTLFGVVTESKFSMGHSVTFWQDFVNEGIQLENGKVKPILMGKHLLELGFEAGPQMGKILKEIFKKQLDDEINTLEEAIQYIKKVQVELF